MEINTAYWGESATWVKDTFFWSTATTYTDDNLAWYNAANRTFQANTNIEINKPIDYSICYAAHAAAEKMPLADIAVYDYQVNKVMEQTENAGFFFCDIPNISTDRTGVNAWAALKNNVTADINQSSTKRWLEQARTSYSGADNVILPLRPVLQFGIKSLFLDIRVVLIKNDYSARQYLWLKDLEDNISTYQNDWHIEECYGRVWGYNGRNTTGTEFNPFIQKSRTAYGNIGDGSIAIDKNLKIIDSEIEVNNYCQFLSNGFLPIFGTGLNNIANYRNLGHFGIYITRRYSAYYQYYDHSYPICMASAADMGVSVYSTTDEYGYPAYLLNPKMSITAENIEKLRKGAAAYGLFFTDKDPAPLLTDTTNLARYINADMYCGILDDNGVGHGEYTKGQGNIENKVFQYDNSSDNNYDPSKPPTPIDPNTYSNVTNFNLVTESAAMTRRYVLNAANVEKLGDDLWTICQEIATGGDFEYFDGKLKNEFLTTNPIDCIISLMRFPFNVPYQLQPLQSYVKLGRSEGSAKGWITVFISNQINFAGVNIFPRFGNCYIDYEPYTTYELYIPFCGTTKIRAADILGHTLNVSMIIDLITGSCTAYIKADQLVIETVNGSCGVSQQISGIDTATMNANIYNGILNQKQAKTQLLTQAASALMPSNWVNPIGYAAKGEQAESSYKAATYAIEHMETPVHNIGAASPLLGWIQEFDARLLIYYPEGDVIDSNIPPSFKAAPLAAFGHLKGFATATPGTVSNFQMSGKAAFISGDIIPDGIPCTQSERNRIKSMFADGVYLPPR